MTPIFQKPEKNAFNEVFKKGSEDAYLVVSKEQKNFFSRRNCVRIENLIGRIFLLQKYLVVEMNIVYLIDSDVIDTLIPDFSWINTPGVS